MTVAPETLAAAGGRAAPKLGPIEAVATITLVVAWKLSFAAECESSRYLGSLPPLLQVGLR